MKHLHSLLLLIAVLLMSSCSQVYKFVQVFENQSADKNAPFVRDGEGLVFEDEDCAIYYFPWSEGGDASFIFQNKTNEIIYIDLAKSFFIRNGIANDYFKERAWSETRDNTVSTQMSKSAAVAASGSYSVGATAAYLGNFGSMPLTTNDPIATSISVNKSASYGVLYSASQANAFATSKSSSIAIKEQPIIAIPPHAVKIIAEYSISNTLFLDCELERYPNEKAEISFTENNSPLVFENYITYRIGSSEQDKVVENKFYVSKITNYAQPYIREYVERESKPCQNMTDDDSKNYKTQYPIKVYDRVISIDTYNCFYLEYKKSSTRKLYKKAGGTYYYNSIYDGYTESESSNSGFIWKSTKK